MDEARRLEAGPNPDHLAEASGRAAFDRICRLAASVAGTPVAVVAVFGMRDVRLAARIGVSLERLPGGDPLCARIAAGAGPVILADAAAEPELASGALGAAVRGLRFCAGVPVRPPGGPAVGLLLVADRQARPGDHAGLAQALSDLAALAADAAVAAGGDEDLRARSEQFHLAVEAAELGTFDEDQARGTYRWSDRARRILGVAPDAEASSALFWSCVHPDDREHLRRSYRAVRAAPDGRYEVEYRVVRPDGRERWLSERGRIHRAFGCEGPVRHVGVVMDATERKDLEEALLESERRSRLAVEAGGFGTSDWRAGTDELVWSDRARAIFGVEPGARVTRAAFWSLVHPDDRESLRAALRACLDPRNDPRISEEYRIVRPDGTLRWVSGQGRALFDRRDGVCRPARIIGILSDVTERRTLEEALRAGEEHLRLAVEATRLGTWDFDLRTGRAVLSGRACAIFRLPPGSMLDRDRFLALVHPDDRDRVDQALRAARDPASQGTYEVEMRIAAGEGAPRWVSVRGRALADGAGGPRRPSRLLGTVQDVTDRKRAEERLQSSLAQKEMLLREVHHRVKNNLQAIWGMVQAEAARLRGNPEAVERLAAIGERIGVLGRLHQQLYGSRDVSRIDLAPYLAELVENLIALHGRGDQVALEARLDRLRCDLDTALPLGLIVNELASNSLKHAFPAGEKGTIRLRLARFADGSVELEVGDDGAGSRAGAEGKGLGMVLVASLARQLDAAWTAESGAGTRTRLLLPGAPFADSLDPSEEAPPGEACRRGT